MMWGLDSPRPESTSEAGKVAVWFYQRHAGDRPSEGFVYLGAASFIRQAVVCAGFPEGQSA